MFIHVVTVAFLIKKLFSRLLQKAGLMKLTAAEFHKIFISFNPLSWGCDK